MYKKRNFDFCFLLTRLSGSAPYRLTPGSRSNAVDGLNSDLILGPLLQVLDGELSLQPVCDDVQQGFRWSSSPAVLHTVTHRIRVPIVLPFRKRLMKNRVCELCDICMFCLDCRTIIYKYISFFFIFCPPLLSPSLSNSKHIHDIEMNI